jgi:hypothetical protein
MISMLERDVDTTARRARAEIRTVSKHVYIQNTHKTPKAFDRI